MSREVKKVLIGVAAGLLAAIILGIFLLHNSTFYRSDFSLASSSPTVTSSSANSSVTFSTSQDTLTIFCNALEARDYATQYDQLSNTLQSQASEAEYAAQVEQTDKRMGNVTGCTLSNVSQGDSSATATLTLTRSNGTTVNELYTLIKENGLWKIDSFQ